MNMVRHTTDDVKGEAKAEATATDYNNDIVVDKSLRGLDDDTTTTTIGYDALGPLAGDNPALVRNNHDEVRVQQVSIVY